MRKLFIAGLICLLLAQPVYANENSHKSPEDMEHVILRLLTVPMLDAIENYYGQTRLYWPDSDKVLSIQQVPDSTAYEVITQVETFYGPHNPPYGIETMTFLVAYGEVQLVSFDHQDKPV